MNGLSQGKIDSIIKKRYLLSKYWLIHYKIKNWFTLQKRKNKDGFLVLVGIGIPLIFMIGLAIFSNLNQILEQYFSSNIQFHNLQTLLITLSGSLLAVAAIAFSFIMFAMQINVDRMPYGLFRKLSLDTELSIYFIFLFLLPLIIGAFSMVSNLSLIPWIIIGTIASIISIVFLLFMAYKKALKLISPIEQLKLLNKNACKSLISYSKAASRFSPLIEEQFKKNNIFVQEISGDIYRSKYFEYNPDWAFIAHRSLHYAFLLAKKYAVYGDYEISKFAMDTIKVISECYIETKEKTFVNDIFLLVPSISQDKFINETLEHFRIDIQEGFSTGNEKFIQQFFYGIKQLCLLYLDIDYSSTEKHKSHANLAISYFTNFIETAALYKLTDIVIEGFRMLEEIAFKLIIKGEINDLASISEKIALISIKSIEDEKTRAITYAGVEKFAKLTFFILKGNNKNISYILNRLQEQIICVAENALKLNGYYMQNVFNNTLKPYFSMSSNETLAVWLTNLTNETIKIENKNQEQNQSIKSIIENVVCWSNELPQMQRKLLLLAISCRSSFVSDIIFWVEQIVKIFLALSGSINCSEVCRDRLIKDSEHLIFIFSHIPDNKEAVSFMQNYNLVDKLFSSSLEAKKYNYYDCVLKIRQVLLFWTFQLCKYGCRINDGIYALVSLNLLLDLNDSALVADINQQLKAISIENENILSVLDCLENRIKQCGISLPPINLIDAEMNEVDQEKLRELLTKIFENLKKYVNSHVIEE